VLVLEPFVLGVAILALFQPDGWRLFFILVAKCTLCLLTMSLLSNTTPFSDLLRVLKSWRLPALLVTTLSLMYRYMFVLVDEGQRMSRARMSRTFVPQHYWAWHTLATVVSQLFIRSSERAERIYAAMCARGWK
jgi:cobalt/nickel transport system permease protein